VSIELEKSMVAEGARFVKETCARLLFTNTPANASIAITLTPIFLLINSIAGKQFITNDKRIRWRRIPGIDWGMCPKNIINFW
jgi:hypothetical protein